MEVLIINVMAQQEEVPSNSHELYSNFLVLLTLHSKNDLLHVSMHCRCPRAIPKQQSSTNQKNSKLYLSNQTTNNL